MIIRITENSEGIEHYFESGQKKGQQKSREEIDKRVYLSGDLDAFSDVIRYTNKAKKWKNHYWHITGSFAMENQQVSYEKIKDIHSEILEYYFCRYNPEKIIHASEIHRPKIQTGAIGQQRYVHFHVAISKWDQETDNQLRIIPFRLNADKAFQSYLALKYKLEDPANHKRFLGKPTVENLVTKQTGKFNIDSPDKPTLSIYKYKISRLLDGVGSIDEAKVLLMNQKDITSVAFKKTKNKKKDSIIGGFTGKIIDENKHLQIKSNLFPKSRPINLRGKGFEELEKLYYTPEELEYRINRDIYKPVPAPDQWKTYDEWERTAEAFAQRSIFLKHQNWWKGQAMDPKKKKTIDYFKLEKGYAPEFENLMKEELVCVVISPFSIMLEQIRGPQLWEKNNARYLLNNDLGVKIYDRPDKIIFNYPNDLDKGVKTLNLALTNAQAKGWDIQTLKIIGANVFVWDIQQQIDRLIESGKLDNIEPATPVKIAPKPKPYLNAVGQLQADLKENKSVSVLTKGRIKAINTNLDPQTVINIAIKEWELLSQYYIVVGGNQIGDKRIKKKQNLIDFLTNTCNQPLSEVLPLLDKLLRIQEQTKLCEIKYEETQHLEPEYLHKIEESKIEQDSPESIGDGSQEEIEDDSGLRM